MSFDRNKLTLDPLKATSPSTVCEQPSDQPILDPEKKLEWKMFLTHLMRGSEDDARNTLVDFLSGKEVKETDVVRCKFSDVAHRIESVLKPLILPRILAIPSSDKGEDKRRVWLYRCLSTMQKVREQIPSGKILGTEDRLYNAFYGMTRFKLFDPGIAQEASVHKNKGIKERLERWRYLQPSMKPKYQTDKRDVQLSSPPVLLEEQLEVAGMNIKISCAHLQGDRPTQEDGHVIGKINLSQEEIGFFAILDGHAGSSLTTFLQVAFTDALREHLETAGKPLKNLMDGEIENLLTTFPVTLQQIWKRNKDEWGGRCLVDDFEDYITKLFAGLIKRYRSSFELCEASTQALFMKIIKGLHSHESTEGNQASLSVLFDLVAKVVSEEKIKVRSSDLIKEEEDFFHKLFQDLKINLQFGKEHWEYDPGAVLTMDLIMDRTHGPELWTLNVGDSGSLVVQDGRVFQATEEATLCADRFQRQIEHRGGWVKEIKDGALTYWRVGPCGVNVARSIGDMEQKGVSSRATVQKLDIKFPCTAVLGCDGLFDRCSYLEVGEKFIQSPDSPVAAATLALDAYSKGSSDNISCIVAQIQPKPQENA